MNLDDVLAAANILQPAEPPREKSNAEIRAEEIAKPLMTPDGPIDATFLERAKVDTDLVRKYGPQITRQRKINQERAELAAEADRQTAAKQAWRDRQDAKREAADQARTDAEAAAGARAEREHRAKWRIDE